MRPITAGTLIANGVSKIGLIHIGWPQLYENIWGGKKDGKRIGKSPRKDIFIIISIKTDVINDTLNPHLFIKKIIEIRTITKSTAMRIA